MPSPAITAVIDSTVFVAAAIAIDAGRATVCRTLVEDTLIRRRLFVHYTSMPILYELGDVLARVRIPFARENVVEYVTLIERASTRLGSVQGIVMGCRDQRDDKILETAVNGNARYIVSRDKDLLEASPGEKYAITKVGIGIREEPIAVVTAEGFLYGVLGYSHTVKADGPRTK
jgi:putative PIN family toxin of toxin-antitoxin system